MARTYFVLIAVLMAFSLTQAQYFSDQGLLSGSGLTLLPTVTTVPSTEFRVQFSRMDYMKEGWKGTNVFCLGAGLSTSFEAYMRLMSEQMGTAQSQMSYGFGGKFRIPAYLPVIRRVALWAENTSSDQAKNDALFPTDILRMGLIVTLDSNGIHPSLFLGISRTQQKTEPLLGAGMTIALESRAQVGIEAIYGYLDLHSIQAAASASVRILPNVGIQLSPGYIKTSKVSMWTISFGISLSTSDLDFHPMFGEQVPDEYTLPSIEEMERQGSITPSGGGSTESGSPPQPSEEKPHE